MKWSDRFIARCLWVDQHTEPWPEADNVLLGVTIWEWDDDEDRTDEVDHRFVLTNEQAQSLALEILAQVTLNWHNRDSWGL